MSGSTAQPMLTCQRAPCGLAHNSNDWWMKIGAGSILPINLANLAMENQT